MNLSELKQLIEPYVARGDQFADDFHRLLTTVETDLGLGGAPKAEPAAPPETDPTAQAQAEAVAANREAVQAGKFSETTGPAPVEGDNQDAHATVEPETVTGPVVADTPAGTEPAPATEPAGGQGA